MNESQAPAALFLTTQFSYFFASRRREKPAVDQPAAGGRLPGWLEWLRAEDFQTLWPSDPVRWEGEPWSGLRARVFLLEHRALSVVLAAYGPTDILWLDDHSDEADFNEFVRREELLRWLPDHGLELARLICATRQNYLGRPMLVQSATEIPAHSEADKSNFGRAGMAETLESILDGERRLAAVRDRVQPVMVTRQPDGAWRLAFALWTQFVGRLLVIEALVAADGTCRFEGEELARFVGRGFVPR